MNFKTVLFLVVLMFIVGIVIGFSIKKKPEVVVSKTQSSITVHDTVIKIKKDTIKIPVEKIRYFTKVDTLVKYDTFEYNDTPREQECVSFPLLLSDSSLIEVTECSTDGLPDDLTYDAKYIDKRERIRIVSDVRFDTVRIEPKIKRVGFAIGPSAGIGIDVNNIKQPVYFIGATLTYGWRF